MNQIIFGALIIDAIHKKASYFNSIQIMFARLITNHPIVALEKLLSIDLFSPFKLAIS